MKKSTKMPANPISRRATSGKPKIRRSQKKEKGSNSIK